MIMATMQRVRRKREKDERSANGDESKREQKKANGKDKMCNVQIHGEQCKMCNMSHEEKSAVEDTSQTVSKQSKVEPEGTNECN